MKNFNMTAKTTARAIGVILILTGLVFAQVDITCKFEGLGINHFFSAKGTFSPSLNKDTIISIDLPPSLNYVIFKLPSGSWTGNISITQKTDNYGFSITPKDIAFRGLKTDTTFIVTITDTSRPDVKIHLEDTIINVNQLFTFFDSIKDNSLRIDSIKHHYSIDGINWNPIPSITVEVPLILSSIGYYVKEGSFYPSIPCDSFWLRTIVIDPVHLADTSKAVFKVIDNVGVHNPTKTVRSKVVTAKFSMYDLAGRKMSIKGPSKIYVKNTQHVLIVR